MARERPVGRLLAGVAGGPSGGGDGQLGGCRRAANRAQMSDVGGEARVIERAAVEPGCEMALRRRVGAAGIRRGVALAQLARLVDAGGLSVEQGADLAGVDLLLTGLLEMAAESEFSTSMSRSASPAEVAPPV